jgi:hypothetical protein
MEFRRRSPKNKNPKIPIERHSKRAIDPLRICVAALLSLCAVAAAGQTIEISPGDCGTGVHLAVRQALLADVLKKLAHTLDFELRYEGDEKRRIDMNATRWPVELISSLFPQDSIIVTQAKDTKCPGRNRVVKVWVLPASKQMTPDARPSASPAAHELVIRGSAELEEQSRRAKAAYDEYVRLHGVPPPGVPEEAANP